MRLQTSPKRDIGEKEIYKDVADRYGISYEDVKTANNQAAWVEAIALCAENEETPEFMARRKENEKLKKVAEELIEQFYKDRKTEDAAHLEFENIGGDGHFRIHNGGEDYAQVADMSVEQKKELGERLLGYRAEMQAFGKFLKDKFF